MVHVIFDPSAVTLDELFQEGGGFYFQGIPFQRGYGYRGAGIGSLFRSLIRYILPLAKRAGKSVGKEAIITGAKILDNIAQGAEFKDTLKTEVKRGTKRLAQRYANSNGVQEGAGAKRRKVAPKRKTPALPTKQVAKKKVPKRFTKRELLGRRVLQELVQKTPKNRLGFY